jgi:hypothetical protein
MTMIVDAQHVRRAVLLLRGKAEDARSTEQRARARASSSDGFPLETAETARLRGRAEAFESAATVVEDMLQESRRGAR